MGTVKGTKKKKIAQPGHNRRVTNLLKGTIKKIEQYRIDKKKKMMFYTAVDEALVTITEAENDACIHSRIQ